LLLDILKSSNVKQKSDASMALHQLAAKASSSFSLFDIASPSPTLQVFFALYVWAYHIRLFCFFSYLLNNLYHVI